MTDESSIKRTDYLDWDEYFMATAHLASLRSKDPNTQVGCCIVNKERKIVGVGYNGMPTGCNDDLMPWMKKGKTPMDNKHLYVCHAEMNAIANRNSADVKDCTLYTTLYPCNECAKLIIQSGIREVVYTHKKNPDDLKNKASKRMLDMVNIYQHKFQPKRKKIVIDFTSLQAPLSQVNCTYPSYNILITTLGTYRYINAICGFGELLTRHGHNVTFAHRSKFRKLAYQHGFKFISLDENLFSSSSDEKLIKCITDIAARNCRDPLERFKNFTEEEKEILATGVDLYRQMNEALKKVISKHSFDAIVQDRLDVLDCLHKTKIPVISSFSASPLILNTNGPPPTSGLAFNSDKHLWSEYEKNFNDALSKLNAKMNILLKESGRNEKFNAMRWGLSPKTIGFYHYPSDLDYDECGPRLPGWHRIDCYVRSPDEETFELPEKLKNKPGKLIYFSLGTGASADLVMMRKCLTTISKSPHRFIVSIGQRGEQLQLADNMWGQPYINQMKAIEKVDLVITHGGNNTFMEALYHGKPMIVIPYFYDQLDNAQRVVDKQIGFRVNPWEFDEDYFLKCIEEILNDHQLQERVKKISENMRNSNSGDKAVKMIEKIIESHKSN